MALVMRDVRAAIAQAFETTWGGEVQIATAPDQITPPTILVGMPTVTYNHASQRALDRYELPILGISPRTVDQAAVDQADAWTSGDTGQSLRAILEDDQTLGGACAALQVMSATPELWDAGGAEYPAYRFIVEVYG